jgi:hypothetical protein
MKILKKREKSIQVNLRSISLTLTEFFINDLSEAIVEFEHFFLFGYGLPEGVIIMALSCDFLGVSQVILQIVLLIFLIV